MFLYVTVSTLNPMAFVAGSFVVSRLGFVLCFHTPAVSFVSVSRTWYGGHHLSDLQSICSCRIIMRQSLSCHFPSRVLFFFLVHLRHAHRMVVFPALSSPSTRILASRSPNSEYSFVSHSPIATVESADLRSQLHEPTPSPPNRDVNRRGCQRRWQGSSTGLGRRKTRVAKTAEDIGVNHRFLCGDRSGMGKRAVQPTVRTQERETDPMGPKAPLTRENDRGTGGGTGIERG